jgi:hypothetical protein
MKMGHSKIQIAENSQVRSKINAKATASIAIAPSGHHLHNRTRPIGTSVTAIGQSVFSTHEYQAPDAGTRRNDA